MTIVIPAGFHFGSFEAGIKHANRKDFGMIISDSPASAAAVFTQNKFAAAPVHYSREILHKSAGIISGVVVNAGCANAATGDAGYANTVEMGQQAASTTGAAGPFLVCSTGTIGVQLPMDKISTAMRSTAENLHATPEAFIDFSEAIRTTDTVRKVATSQFEVDGTTVTLTGCAKGSGMIHPNMATMLAYVVTDADIEPPLLQQVFARIIDRTINCVTVDGDTSTNDTAIILANGASGVRVDQGNTGFHLFERALTEVLETLAKKLARDGEGATHLVQVTVSGAPTFVEARKAAMAVANSPLVKTAIYGRDANWGRIACALGYSGVEFDASKTDISLGDIELMRDGSPVELNESRALEILSQEEIAISADLKAGNESATVWTCDLTEKYIEINGSYRT